METEGWWYEGTGIYRHMKQKVLQLDDSRLLTGTDISEAVRIMKK